VVPGDFFILVGIEGEDMARYEFFRGVYFTKNMVADAAGGVIVECITLLGGGVFGQRCDYGPASEVVGRQIKEDDQGICTISITDGSCGTAGHGCCKKCVEVTGTPADFGAGDQRAFGDAAGGHEEVGEEGRMVVFFSWHVCLVILLGAKEEGTRAGAMIQEVFESSKGFGRMKMFNCGERFERVPRITGAKVKSD